MNIPRMSLLSEPGTAKPIAVPRGVMPEQAQLPVPAGVMPTDLTSLVEWAKWHPCNRPNGTGGSKRHNHSLCEAGQLIIDSLDVALPCGVETPTATADGSVQLPDVGGTWSVEDARGIAAAILRAAEEAERRGR